MLPKRYYWEGKEFSINHKNYDYKVLESPSSIMVTRKPMVCESPGNGLVVQGEDVSPLIHLTWGNYIVV
jgi:hypothetical protein